MGTAGLDPNLELCEGKMTDFLPGSVASTLRDEMDKQIIQLTEENKRLKDQMWLARNYISDVVNFSAAGLVLMTEDEIAAVRVWLTAIDATLGGTPVVPACESCGGAGCWVCEP